jgi:hypothetical protein
MSAGSLRALLVVLGVVLVTGSGASRANAATALPAHVYAPYFETRTTDSISTMAQQSGSRYFTLAFLETLSKTSCTAERAAMVGITLMPGLDDYPRRTEHVRVRRSERPQLRAAARIQHALDLGCPA